MDNLRPRLSESLLTGFVDREILSDLVYQPELLVNHKTPPKKILSTILNELGECIEFYISVAFVTTSGVATIINELKDLEQKQVKGYILVSQYLNFTQPEALRRLLQFKNIDLRIMTAGNAHAKGYIFKKRSHYNLIVGSSNLTANALSTNKEWNIKLSALGESSMVNDVLKEFRLDFENATVVDERYIEMYNTIYQSQFLLAKKIKNQIFEKIEEVSPNLMQMEALRNLSSLRAQGKNKAIIISATGTGKTYLSAFDAREFKARKLLFVVHRLSVAKSAMKTFRKVFQDTRSMGLYSGDNKELHKDFIFSTVQTISKLNHLEQFAKDYFDYIIIDETHRSASTSYVRILDHFRSKFLMGMTATPERTDGIDIFHQFDYNIGYEIRLNRAMEADMLSTFHYYGVTDLIVDNKIIDDKSDFNLLVSEERVNQIIEKSLFYGTDNGITRGLIFCSRQEEAIKISDLLNLKGFRSRALTGKNTEQERFNAIELLESDDLSKKLDYIITVDIFNEGIDIPKINQIIMLRPTESAIVFIQQLGRGLRKIEGKGYLTVIDFIGNYQNNYLIPIALYGDTSYNKDTIRKLLYDGSRMIPGASTINFDKITKERIFQSIDSANMQLFADLKKDYNLLKFRLGRIPMMVDFLSNESRDPFLFVEHSKSYYNFVKKVEKDGLIDLTAHEIKLLEWFSREINNSKRVEESLILKFLIDGFKLSINDLSNYILEKYNYLVSHETIKSCLINLNFEFIRNDQNIIHIINNYFEFQDSFSKLLSNKVFKDYLLDSVHWSIRRFESTYSRENYRRGLLLYNKYSRKDVCRLLNWDRDISSTVYGYRTHSKITPCFVTYHKSKDIDDSIKYNDHFINKSTFAWESRSDRKLEDSKEIKQVIDSERILLFIKKEDGEGKDFYFLGDVSIIENSIKQEYMQISGLPVVHFKFQLETALPDNVYNYFTEAKTNLELEGLSNAAPNQIVDFDRENVKIDNENYSSVPLYNFYAAAGSFSEMQSDKNFSMIEILRRLSDSSAYFACKVIGESMNRVIPNGSICLFKMYDGGSRNGKIVLVENLDLQDEDFNSAFTVKTYLSEKIAVEDGWQHELIRLRSNSYDKSYSDILIEEENARNMKVVGEFVTILDQVL
ncbi:DUF3427 domain-containing protein [Sphingobacterium sp.]|uniref:DUF3427 domain-containing protein n=1 Tax=Sphingobacterium sp. TaxID=341027 RepID=UPI00289A3E25|nr:DUF3427 domain-containing protein [Sphingobacterium sp.]